MSHSDDSGAHPAPSGKGTSLTDGIRYGEQGFWEEKYAGNSNTVFDWYLTYAEMKELIHKHIAPHQDLKILMVGCGNSPLAENMLEDGYSEFSPILSVDCSASVIQQMQQRASDLKMNLEYKCMDCRDMSELASASFDVILDKGTMDALVCGDEYDKDIPAMVRECYRLLKPNGLYMVISFGMPQFRLPFFNDIKDKCQIVTENWKNPSKPNDPQVYYVYLARKPGQSS